MRGRERLNTYEINAKTKKDNLVKSIFSVTMFLFLFIISLSNVSAADNLTINSTNGNDWKNLIDNYNGTDIIFEDVEINNFSYSFNKKLKLQVKTLH
ncbi:hypothetical protein ALNOE001_01590 [Candidatus Methanobinarius endosymbioticus]|uniref:Uncharacterized protein n=1 Tax=Candidatus Methanobinarius endosymbioticus TaxID=2006182 RepID=A0A366MFY0_9EURY|nr:hypothetical protein ALNOE001_01590 [Candidatus Methanobinarius endosymbioticus]